MLGIVAGSWQPEIAARVPDGARVVLAVDHDETGEKYTATIAASLGERVTLLRWEPLTV